MTTAPTHRPPAHADDITMVRELDSRLLNGLQVRLLWNQAANRLFVTVFDRGTGDSFRLAVRDDEDPLDVFNHPFAYAARRGIQLRSVRPQVPTESPV